MENEISYNENWTMWKHFYWSGAVSNFIASLFYLCSTYCKWIVVITTRVSFVSTIQRKSLTTNQQENTTRMQQSESRSFSIFHDRYPSHVNYDSLVKE